MILLQDDSIKLRALETTDLDLLYTIENDTEFWEVSSNLIPFSKDLLRSYLKNAHQDIYEAKQLRLIVSTLKTSEVIGMVDLFDFSPRHNRAGIGILILKPHQAKGYGSQALRLFCDYAFKHLDLHQLYANIPVSNKRSLALFSNLGFKEIGIQKEWIKVAGEYQDVALVQLINSNHI